jgi:hypothetical protein
VIAPSEIDQLLLSFCVGHWRKVARVIGSTMQVLEERGVQIDGTIADQIDARMAVLVNTGQLEAKGDIRKWRFSEVRLPGERIEAVA